MFYPGDSEPALPGLHHLRHIARRQSIRNVALSETLISTSFGHWVKGLTNPVTFSQSKQVSSESVESVADEIIESSSNRDDVIHDFRFLRHAALFCVSRYYKQRSCCPIVVVPDASASADVGSRLNTKVSRMLTNFALYSYSSSIPPHLCRFFDLFLFTHFLCRPKAYQQGRQAVHGFSQMRL